MKKKGNWKVLILILLVIYSITFIGSLLSFGNTDSDWYNSLKPSFTPPSWLFSPVWITLYFLIGLSLYFTWINSNKEQKKKIGIIFGINIFVNALWSYLFFGLQNPFLAFLDIVLILVTIILMIYLAGKIDKKSAWLLIPYLAWVGFASVLNFYFLI